MIIPIRCLTCNKVLADIYEYYIQQTADDKVDKKEILDKLELKRYCCRRHLITTEDLMKII
tara:strand:+ start:465 stop:647 length:183 start_codon:yes stop_codon:yes gene_type:complete